MSLLPWIDPFDYAWRPSRLVDQQFGLGLDPEDVLRAVVPREARQFLGRPGGGYYHRPWLSAAAERDAGSTVTVDKDKFQVSLDVQHFRPDEIQVRASGDDTIEIEGRHEEKRDEHGYVSRHFVRKYRLPEGHDIGKIQPSLSSDGVLTITAPRSDAKALEQRTIPIQQTGAPAKGKKAEKEEKKK